MLLAWISTLAFFAELPDPTPFQVSSADSYLLNGQVDRAISHRRGVVIMVAGTGAFDRDVRLGRSGTDRDAVFADLARRFAARGLDVVRYDRRGVRFRAAPTEVLEPEAYRGVTAENLSRDLEAVYAWTRSADGPGSSCVVMLIHSEGAAHLAGLAERGVQPPPSLILGVGAFLESKASVLSWQMTERDAESLRLMDGDGDGEITNAEVRENLAKTPSAVFERLEPFLQADGVWSSEDLALVHRNQSVLFESARIAALARPDDAPYPNAGTPAFSQAWWKSWFTDDRPLAMSFARWDTPMILHYGTLDSQVREDRQRRAAEGLLDARRVRFVTHVDRGHTLGGTALLGPMDETIADGLADEAARGCVPD